MKTNKGSRYFDGSKKSNFGIVDWWWCGLIENIHRLFVVGDNVFELPVNALVIVTFKNENVKNDIIKNIDETFDEWFSTCWMKTFQSDMIERSADTKHNHFSKWFGNFIVGFEILPVTWSGFWRFVIIGIDGVIYWWSCSNYPQSISSFFITYLKTKKRTIVIETDVVDVLQPVKKSGLSRIL